VDTGTRKLSRYSDRAAWPFLYSPQRPNHFRGSAFLLVSEYRWLFRSVVKLTTRFLRVPRYPHCSLPRYGVVQNELRLMRSIGTEMSRENKWPSVGMQRLKWWRPQLVNLSIFTLLLACAGCPVTTAGHPLLEDSRRHILQLFCIETVL
jgi:hypothetical protein